MPSRRRKAVGSLGRIHPGVLAIARRLNVNPDDPSQKGSDKEIIPLSPRAVKVNGTRQLVVVPADDVAFEPKTRRPAHQVGPLRTLLGLALGQYAEQGVVKMEGCQPCAGWRKDGIIVYQAPTPAG